jgi:multidrug resistance efflux pump
MKTRTILFILLVSSLTFSACGATSAQTDNDPTEVPVVEDFSVVAEGRLVPKESVQLSFVTGGRVAEIFVAEGDNVEAGDVIACLGDRESLEANLAGAELELLTSSLELDNARLELLNAQTAYDELYKNWPAMFNKAQQDLTDARQEVHDTERNLNYLTSTAAQFDIDAAWSQVVLAEDALQDAEEKFEPYENKPDDNLTRAVYQNKLAQAQKAYEAAVRNYNASKGTANDFDIHQARASFSIAQTRLEQAQKDYDELEDGPDLDDVALAEARIESAQTRINTAQGRMTSAEANIKAARASLDNLELTATFDGVIASLDLLVGEQVSPGNPVAVLADFSNWYVETDNLTEIEVVDVAGGQSVTIVPDALPEIELSGIVERIDDVFEEKRGDITYTTRILLNDIDPRLRWGMTVVVTFEE